MKLFLFENSSKWHFSRRLALLLLVTFCIASLITLLSVYASSFNTLIAILIYIFVVPFLVSFILFGLNTIHETNTLRIVQLFREVIAHYGTLSIVFFLRLIVLVMPVILTYRYIVFVESVPEWNVVYQNADTIAEQYAITALLLFFVLYPLLVGAAMTLLYMTDACIVLNRQSISTAVVRTFKRTPKLLAVLFGLLLLCVFYIVSVSVYTIMDVDLSFNISQWSSVLFQIQTVCSLLVISNSVFKYYLYRQGNALGSGSD